MSDLSLLVPKCPSTDDYQSLPWIAQRLTHKLRNPLSVITTAASQIELTPDEPIGEDELSFIRSIIEAADSLNDVLKRFTLFACHNNNTQIQIDLNELCQSRLAHASDRASGQSSSVNAEFVSSTDDLFFNGDSEIICVMIDSLLENAFESITNISGGSIKLSVCSQDNSITIEIRDNGSGIPPEQLPLVACPFVTTKPGKTGLGLSIADQAVRRHNGNMRIQSEKHIGTTVTITLNTGTHKRSGNALDFDS
ncbi:MAG: HAMP domain-containing histidine kinase [candidate division Zixibacteria bacterium]|nr:HAMP domain-containing histidine kinase [candidate division Zixibacteria bacterium]